MCDDRGVDLGGIDGKREGVALGGRGRGVSCHVIPCSFANRAASTAGGVSSNA